MRPERLREITEQAQEAQRSLAAGEHAPRERAFRAVAVASVLALIAAAAAIAFGAELLVEAINPKSRSSFDLFQQVFGAHGQAAGMALGLEMVLAGFAMGVGAGICLTGAIMEHLWIGTVMRWSAVAGGALLVGLAVGFLALFRAGFFAGALPFDLMLWLGGTAVPTTVFLAACAFYLPAFRRGE